MKCKICNSKTYNIFKSQILDEFNISYYFCDKCEFLQTEPPYWLEKAYENPINLTDCGIIQRNIQMSKICTCLIFLFFNRSKYFLDYSGGYGIFVRLMRDYGLNFHWYDPYTSNIFAQFFKSEKDKNYNLLTNLESFEHLPDPISEIQKMLKLSSNILFTTQLLPEPIPKPGDYYYYGLHHGQHISFYRLKTLKKIAKIFDLNFCSNGYNIHLLSKNKISNVKFNYCLKLCKFGFFHFVKRFLTPKIYDDRLYIIRKLFPKNLDYLK